MLLQGFIKFRACFMTVETLQQSTSSLHIYLRWILIIGCILSPSKSPKKWTAVNHSPKFGSVEDGEKTQPKKKLYQLSQASTDEEKTQPQKNYINCNKKIASLLNSMNCCCLNS